MESSTADHGVRNMLQDLRKDLLRQLPLPTAAVFYYAFLIANHLYGLQPLPLWIVATGTATVCLLAYYVQKRWPRLAALVYIAGLTLAALFFIWAFYSPLIIALLSVVILLSIAVLGARSAAVIAALGSLVILASAWRHAQWDRAVWGPLSIVWLTTGVAWLSQRNQITAIGWAWSSYTQARESMEDAQSHRGELARTLKALDEAYYRLERFSVQLALAREAAEEARRAKQLFVANVSHELRTPLNIIIGFSEMLALSPESYGVEMVPRQFMGDINRVYRSAGHLQGLIDDVLDLSQADAHHMPLITERALPAEVIAEAVDMMESLAVQKGLHLIVDVSETLPAVFLDRLRVRQVLLNLLNNAIRLTEAGQVTVSARLEEREIRVTVADTGPGIANEDIPKIFEEFRQLDASLSRRRGGVGLGLALSQRFIKLHGGRMWVDSQLGQGSQFHFTLPLVPSLVNPMGVPRIQPAIPSQIRDRVGQTLLSTAEDPMVVNMLKRHLHGFQVIGVPKEELEHAVGTYMPRAIITNEIASPADRGTALSVSGDETALSHVPVISCSLPDTHYLGRMLGAESYLVKPVSRERLLDLLAGYGDTTQHVLIVDDDAQLAELLARIVQAAPNTDTVDVACGGQEGLARMREHCPDLVLLDLMMQDMDGLSVLKWMRADEHLCQVPVVIITARDLPIEEIGSLPQNRIAVNGPSYLNAIEMLNCVQAILDALPPPRPSSWPSPRPEADLSARPVY